MIDHKKKTAKVLYSIEERVQCTLKEIRLEGVSEKDKQSILKNLENQVGQPLNIVEIENDLERVLTHLHKRGYYFAEIENLSDTIIHYSINYTESRIHIKINSKQKTLFHSLHITGNKATSSQVIERENLMKSGEIITPDKLKDLEVRLSNLGLFSSIRITPQLKDSPSGNTIIEIHVQEKKFGTGEIAPGFRNDLGAKLSLNVVYRNLTGKNHSLSMKAEVNRRILLTGLDERRKKSGRHRLEGLLRLNYIWPYMTNFFDADFGLSFQRKRLSSFDADIWKVTPKISKQFTKFFSGAIKYQFEEIHQFDATELKDRETFEIGGVTTSLELDFRDHPILPRSGSFHSLSWEYASPLLFSKQQEDLEINFSRLVSRNRFYIPLNEQTLLAISLSGGHQINHAKEPQGHQDGRTRGTSPPSSFSVWTGSIFSEASQGMRRPFSLMGGISMK